MLTVCPKCALTLAVSATDLRLGQGYVRCGRCSDVFNALLSLREESPADTDSTQPQPALRVHELDMSEAVEAALPTETDEMAEAGEAISIVVPALPHPEPQPEPEPEPEPELTYEEFEPAAEPAEPLPEPAEIFEVVFEPTPAPAPVAEEPEPEDIEIFDVDDDEPAEIAALPAASAGLEAAPEWRTPSDFSAVHRALPPDSAVQPPDHGRRQRIVLYAAGIALASLLLIAQGIHHWRNSIASNASWYPLMARVYKALGSNLTPDWNLSNYDLRQLGSASYAVSDQTLWIKLQLGNHGKRALPWPALRLNLSDRYGKRVATRLLQPHDYLAPGNPTDGFLQPAQRIRTEVGVIGEVAATSSFELDVCLPSAGGVRCANDEATGPQAHS